MTTLGFKVATAVVVKQKLGRKQKAEKPIGDTIVFSRHCDKSIASVAHSTRDGSVRDLLGGRLIQPITNEHGGEDGS